MNFTIYPNGLDALVKKLGAAAGKLKQYTSAAGKESGELVLNTQGLRAYPPATDANAPGRMRNVTFGNGKTVSFRMPYYVRGQGLMIPIKDGWYNKQNSETYGKQWHITREDYGARIGNRASYAQYLAGEEQAQAMAKIGWRKLVDVVNEKIEQIRAIFDRWINKLLQDMGLL